MYKRSELTVLDFRDASKRLKGSDNEDDILARTVKKRKSSQRKG